MGNQISNLIILANQFPYVTEYLIDNISTISKMLTEILEEESSFDKYESEEEKIHQRIKVEQAQEMFAEFKKILKV
ncbi:MAG: hypothetical protein RBS56_04265 [Candidatus Gracilibacteria bacterium]|nr:hypothetical protein [Candidatus Gracilibacteria bacterium]